MKNTKFKVGDSVVVVKAPKNSVIINVVGKRGIIKYLSDSIHPLGNLWGVEIDGKEWNVYESELQHDKEHKVLEILRNYDKIRSSKGQGIT